MTVAEIATALGLEEVPVREAMQILALHEMIVPIDGERTLQARFKATR
jgi:hypothetical protein